MPALQQAGETVSRPGTSRSDYHYLMDGSRDEIFAGSPGADNESLLSIAELLGLNMPRGSLVGGAQGSHGAQGAHGEGLSSTPPLFMGTASRAFSVDDSGYLTSHPGSPLPADMSTPGKSIPARSRGRLDSAGTFPPASPTPSPSSQGPFSPGIGTRPYRVGSHTMSDYGTPLEHAFTMNSRSNTPESDVSNISLDNNLSDLMNCLYLHARARSDSGLSTGLPNNCDDPRQQEFANLTNLQTLQGLSNNPTLNYYQHNQQVQQSPIGSPLSSPLASPDKAWSPGSFGSSSLPGSPLFMSSPLRGISGPNPSSPTSPSGPLSRLSSSLDSSTPIPKYHRSDVAQCDSMCTWNDTLPPRFLENPTLHPRLLDNPTFSVKVFLGGVPWDISEAMLVHAFKQFGNIRVEWPSAKQQGAPPPKGYAYIIFECEKQVKALLQACSRDYSNRGNWFIKVSSKRMKAKQVEVIPWTTSDTNWVRSPSQKLDPGKTIFVGGLHGMLNAHGLAKIMNDLFYGVVYAGIDTDKFKYPIGSARVTFNNNRSFFKAVSARFVEIKTDKFTKKVQVLPYLEDSPCSICLVQHGPYFCRESTCFRYFCRSCWHWRHSQDSALVSHSFLTRTSKSHAIGPNTVVGMSLNMNLPLSIRGPLRRDLSRLPGDSLQ